jgi:4-aminobutyrate aminotransferase
MKVALHRRFRLVRAALGEMGYRELFRQMGIRESAFLPGLYEDYPFFGLAARGGFHGRTLDVLSATHSKKVQKEGFPTLRWTRHFPFNDVNLESLIDPTPLSLLLREERLARTVFEEGRIPRELLAFVILEPIQGEGGYVFPEPGFLRKVSEFARAQGALLILDEVQSGLGRTGRWWACEHFGVEPDLITSAKALRVGAVMGRRGDFPETPGVLSTTWGGGALGVSVGCRTIEVIEEEGLLENAGVQGGFLLSGLQGLAERHPLVSNPRGLGLMAAIDLPTKEIKDALVQAAFRRGLMTLGCGERGLRLLPPLNVLRREIALAVSALERAVEDVEKESCREVPLSEEKGAR